MSLLDVFTSGLPEMTPASDRRLAGLISHLSGSRAILLVSIHISSVSSRAFLSAVVKQ